MIKKSIFKDGANKNLTHPTYKKGISLIVLVITVIVLAILATTVIISLSNTNIIDNASNTVFKSDMANFKEAYELYVTSQLIDDYTFNKKELNITATSKPTEFTAIFGDNVPDKYKSGLQIVYGELMYNTTDNTQMQILEELGMTTKTVIPNTLQLGDKVVYTPDASATGSYAGVYYAKDTDTTSATYNIYIEKTKNYTPGTHEWVYMGQDENGNALLISTTATDFYYDIGGAKGWVTGPQNMDNLCNTLYGSATYGKARSFSREDFEMLTDYTGTGYGYYVGATDDGGPYYVETEIGLTIGEIEDLHDYHYTTRNVPNPNIQFENYIANLSAFVSPLNYIKFQKIADKWDNKAFWINGPVTFVYPHEHQVDFILRFYAPNGTYSYKPLFKNNGMENYSSDLRIRPVVVLNSNIQIVKNGNTWTLVAM